MAAAAGSSSAGRVFAGIITCKIFNRFGFLTALHGQESGAHKNKQCSSENVFQVDCSFNSDQ